MANNLDRSQHNAQRRCTRGPLFAERRDREVARVLGRGIVRRQRQLHFEPIHRKQIANTVTPFDEGDRVVEEFVEAKVHRFFHVVEPIDVEVMKRQPTFVFTMRCCAS